MPQLTAAQIRAIGDINKQTPVITFKGKQYKQKYDKGNDGMPYFKLPATEKELEDTFNSKTSYAYAYAGAVRGKTIKPNTGQVVGNEAKVLVFADRSGNTEKIFGANQLSLAHLHNLVRALADMYWDAHPEKDGEHKRGQYMETIATLRGHEDFYNMPPAKFKKIIEVAVDNGYAKIVKKQGKVYISTTNAGLVSEFG